jgi:hypothetical protein
MFTTINTQLTSLSTTILSGCNSLATLLKDCYTRINYKSITDLFTQNPPEFFNQTIAPFNTQSPQLKLLEVCLLGYCCGGLSYAKWGTFGFLYAWPCKFIFGPTLDFALQSFFRFYKIILKAVIVAKKYALKQRTNTLTNSYDIAIMMVDRWKLPLFFEPRGSSLLNEPPYGYRYD